ncbi:MAG: hypothetical protein F6J93_38155 [Oscillatoria sp. SIO1A7]|nr:hypothetical protein [Oscillatoria sp. SIO1A7]
MFAYLLPGAGEKAAAQESFFPATLENPPVSLDIVSRFEKNLAFHLIRATTAPNPKWNLAAVDLSFLGCELGVVIDADSFQTIDYLSAICIQQEILPPWMGVYYRELGYARVAWIRRPRSTGQAIVSRGDRIKFDLNQQ